MRTSTPRINAVKRAAGTRAFVFATAPRRSRGTHRLQRVSSPERESPQTGQYGMGRGLPGGNGVPNQKIGTNGTERKLLLRGRSEPRRVIDEAPGEAEPLLQVTAERPHAPHLGRIVPAEVEVDPSFLGVEVVVVRPLAGDEGVEP